MWETILTAVLWFLLGAVVGVTALFRVCAWFMHNKEWYRDAITDPDRMKETQEGIEEFFYGKKEE